MQYLKTGSPIPNWRELRLTPVCLLDTQALNLRFSLPFMHFRCAGDGGLKACDLPARKRVQMTLALIGPLSRASSWHGASSRAAKRDLSARPAPGIFLAYASNWPIHAIPMADHLVSKSPHSDPLACNLHSNWIPPHPY